MRHQALQGRGDGFCPARITGLVGVGGEAPVLPSDPEGEIAAPEAGTVIGVEQHAGRVDLGEPS